MGRVLGGIGQEEVARSMFPREQFGGRGCHPGEQDGAWTTAEASGAGGEDGCRHGFRIHLRGQLPGLAEGQDGRAGERAQG